MMNKDVIIATKFREKNCKSSSVTFIECSNV